MDNGKPAEYVKIIISSLIILLFTYLVIVDRNVSDELLNLVFIIIGYWFAGKELHKALTKLSEKLSNGNK